MNTRPVTVEGQTFHVPRHITRIDSDENRVHGWQVRFDRVEEGYYSKLFSDKKFSDCPATSLDEAVTHLDVVRRQFTENEHMVLSRKGHKPVAHWRKAKKSHYASHLYFNLRLVTRRRKPQHKTYTAPVGAESDITQAIVNAAYDRCVAAWYWSTAMIAVHGRDAVFDMPVPEDTKTLLSYLPDDYLPDYPLMDELLANLEDIKTKKQPEKSNKLDAWQSAFVLCEQHNIKTLRFLELLNLLRYPRTTTEIEDSINMYYTEVNRLSKKHPGLLEKHPIQTEYVGRGRPGIEYHLTEQGKELLAKLDKCMSA